MSFPKGDRARALRLSTAEDGTLELRSVGVGLWVDPPPLGALVGPEETVGALQTLGVRQPLRLPAQAAGRIVERFAPGQRRPAIDYDSLLLRLDPSASAGAIAVEQGPASQVDGLVVRAPLSGRVFLRPSPDKAEFAALGDTLSLGDPVCLIEVMKTFSRVPYEGEGLPARAIVKQVLVVDGQDVARGDVLFVVEAPVAEAPTEES